MPAITSQNVAQAIVKLVAAQALPALEPVMIMGSLVNRDYEATLAQVGDTVNVPIPGIMVANNIAEGGTVQTQNPSLGNAQVVLNKHVEATFKLPDVTKALANPAVMNLYMQPAIIAVATQIEKDLFGLYPNLTANPSQGTGAAGLGSESVIDFAEKALFNAYVPESLAKSLVVHPDAYSDLRQLQRFTQNNTNGNGGAIATGKVGDIKGFQVYRSQLVPKVAGTAFNLAFARDALALVIRTLPNPLPGTGAVAEAIAKNGYALRVVMSYDPNTLAQQFTVDVLYGVAVLRNVYGVQVLS